MGIGNKQVMNKHFLCFLMQEVSPGDSIVAK